MASSSSVGNGPPPTRACSRPAFAEADHGVDPRRGARPPVPVQAPPEVALDEVTNGYVPWSMSSSVPCAPSKSTFFFLRDRAPDEPRRVDQERDEPPRRAGRRQLHMTSATVGAFPPERLDRGAPRFESAAPTKRLRLAEVAERAQDDPAARGLVLVAGADPPLGGADGPLPLLLAQPVDDRHVVRKNGVRAVAHHELVAHVHVAPALDLVDLSDQTLRVDDHSLRKDACDAGAEDAAGNEAHDELVVPHDERVAGVRTAAVTDDEVGVLRIDVYYLYHASPRRPTARPRSRRRSFGPGSFGNDSEKSRSVALGAPVSTSSRDPRRPPRARIPRRAPR